MKGITISLSVLMFMLCAVHVAFADTKTYSYDKANHLLEVSDTSECVVTTYTYDDNGNRTSRTMRSCNSPIPVPTNPSNVVPEPSMLVLWGLGLFSILLLLRKKQRSRGNKSS